MKNFLLFILITTLTTLISCTTQELKTPPPAEITGKLSYEENKKRIEKAKILLAQILNVKEARTVDNTLLPYNDLLLELDAAYGNAGLFGATHPDKEIREQALKQEQDLDKFSTELSLNVELYNAIKSVNVEKASANTKFFVAKTLKEFKRSGVDKDSVTRQKIAQLQEKLSKVGQTFNKNIREDVRYIYATTKELEGLPADYIKSHPPGKDGEVKISTNYPDIFPVFKYANSEDLRKRAYKAFKNRAYPQNKPVLKELLSLRYEFARTLGYENWAAYITANKMMKSEKAAQKFINRISELAKKRSQEDYNALLAEKRKVYPKAKEIYAWENGYWSNKLKESKYDLDTQEIRKYFEFKKVKSGIFKITQKLFGVRYEPVKDVQLWHEDVEAWDIFDGNKHLGRFYLDLFPRDNKYKHAAHFGFRTGIDGVQLPQATLVTNFPNPRTTDGPALMEHGQVETFLHEFGHLLHGIFGGHHKWQSLSGLKTERDFVEVPSQILEEWIWDTETLQSFATHYETNKPIPASLVEKMKKAKDFGAGLTVRHQMFYASVSLNLYDTDPKNVDIDKLEQTLQNKLSPYKHVPGTHFTYNFGHLNGYSAVYYTYMWSLVIAKDIFSEFEKNGLFDAQTAQRFRDRVLGKGGTNHAEKLVEDFLGRPFSYDAFNKWIN